MLEVPTSVLGRVGAPRWVILPQPFHHILDPPDLLLDLPTEHLILDVQVELFPEVVMQGRDLGLEALIHHCTVGQCLRGRGLWSVKAHPVT